MLGSDLRDGVRGLVTYANQDLDLLWRQVNSPETALAALHDVLPALVDTYGSAAASLAADWYDDHRDAKQVRGNFSAIAADIPETGTNALIGWAASTATDFGGFQALILGGTQRRIATFSRQTVMGSSIQDPFAVGWQRVGVGGCKSGFCDMLIGRGAVYSEATADFAAHDNCQCSAVPAFDA